MVSSLLSIAIYQTHDYQISPALEHIVALSHYTQSYQQIFVSQNPHPTTFITVTAAIQGNNTLVIDHIGLSTSKKIVSFVPIKAL